MSKIIVLDDEAFDSLIGTLKQAMDDSKCLADWLNAKAHAELLIRLSKEMREAHDPDNFGLHYWEREKKENRK